MLLSILAGLSRTTLYSTKQYLVLFIMLFKRVLTSEAVDEILKCNPALKWKLLSWENNRSQSSISYDVFYDTFKVLLLLTSVKRKLVNTVLLLHCAVMPVSFFPLLVKLAKRQLNARHRSQNRVAASLVALSICIEKQVRVFRQFPWF